MIKTQMQKVAITGVGLNNLPFAAPDHNKPCVRAFQTFLRYLSSQFLDVCLEQDFLGDPGVWER